MTVTYTDEIATAKLTTLFKLLFCRWQGSLIKLLWQDLLIYMSFYYVIHFIYRFGLGVDEQKNFEALVVYFKTFNENMPLAFVLGFFCQQVFTRWWDQYQAIPWPYGIAVYVSSTIEGYDEVGRALRRTIMRYVCLSLTMVFRVLAPRVKKRFPKTSDLIEAGLITQSELQIIIDMDQKFPGYSKNWLPLCWAASLVNRARAEGRIKNDYAEMTIIAELNKFRGNCGVLMIYNQICIPLVYVHVVTIAVYSYFIGEVMAQQYVTTTEGKPSAVGSIMDFVPLHLIMEFLFYMGWLKVAETMMNPFGSDDDDFEVNYMIDRNLQMSYLIVDEMHNEHPELLKDQYWHEIPNKLPDKNKKDNDPDEKGERTDLFDVVEKASKMSIRRTTIVDPEATPQASILKIDRVSSALRSDDLVPRPTVISENYQRKNGVQMKQSCLEQEMGKIRMRMQDLNDFLDQGSTDSSHEGGSEVTKRNFDDDLRTSRKKPEGKKKVQLSSESMKSKKSEKENDKKRNSPKKPTDEDEKSQNTDQESDEEQKPKID